MSAEANDSVLRDDGHAHGGKATRHAAEDGEKRSRSAVHINEPGDHGVEEDDEGRSQRRDEEPGFGLLWLSARHVGAKGANKVEHGKRGEAHGGVDVRAPETL